MSLQYKNTAALTHSVKDFIDTEFLDEVLILFQKGHLETAMDILGSNLYFLYTTTSEAEWQEILNSELLVHPVREYIFKDPLTARAFTQPRGYAGDPKLLDMIYFPNHRAVHECGEIGQRLYKYTTHTSVCRTLRKRIRFVANYIDEFANDNPGIRVLSVASGHCREAEYSVGLKSGQLGRFVALDSDPRALQTMANDYGSLGLESMELNVKELIKGSHGLGEFDLIYSAGLYDYLGTRFAQKLTQCLYNMLAPGGKLMIINIAAEYDEIGFLESYMNWAMIGRDKLDTMELGSTVQTNEKAVIQLKDVESISSHYNVLELQKR